MRPFVPVGQRAVRLVAGMLGALTIDAIEGEAKAAGLVMSGGVLESITANLLLHGNAYVQLIADHRAFSRWNWSRAGRTQVVQTARRKSVLGFAATHSVHQGTQRWRSRFTMATNGS